MSTTETVTDTGVAPLRDLSRRPETLGRYTVGAELGSGGMGTVYRAHDPELDRDVALKLLHAPSGEGSRFTEARTRMLREAQAIAKVTHPNVIHVYDVGTVEVDDTEQVFVAMELVEGPSMRTWLAELWRTDRWQRGEAWREIVDVVTQVGRGLAAAHAAGIVHRDLKPDNVLIGDDGLVRVVDFGLARRVREEEVTVPRDSAWRSSGALDEPLTLTGAILGTPAYMAPEQFRGTRTDERTDQFALCLTLFEALFGLRPFESNSREGLACAVMTGAVREWPSSPPAPAYLRPVIERGLKVEPDDRFASVEDLVDALAVDPDRSRRRQWSIVGGVAALVAATSAGAFLAGGEQGDPCDSGGERVAMVWDSARADELRATLRDPDLPYADKTIETTVDALDDYAATWAAAHRDACEATHVRHEQTGDLLDRRMVCLDSRLASLDATVEELLRRDDESLVQRAATIAGHLPLVDDCADLTALTRIAPPPEQATQAAVDDLRERLARTEAKNEAYRFAEAKAAYEALAPEVEATGYAPLMAELQLHIGANHHVMSEIDEAIEATRKALRLAQSSGHDAVVRDAATRLTGLIGTSRGQPEQALLWADLAEATAERVGMTDAQRASLLRSRAWQLVEAGHADEAIRVCEEAVEAAKRAYGEDSLQMAGVHSSMGSVFGRLRRMEEAEVHFQRVVDLQIAHTGPEHPEMINAYLNLGNALSAQHEHEEAKRAFNQSIEVASRLPDVPNDLRARTESSLGNLLVNEGNWEEAITHHREALRLRLEWLGPDHPNVARSHLSLGNAYTNLGRDAEAVEAYKRAIAIRERAHGKDSHSLIDPLDNLGMHFVKRGQAAEGLPYLQRAEAILVSSGDQIERPAHGLWLGRALYESGEDREGGRAKVEAILELDVSEKLKRDAAAWLADNG